MKSLLLKTLKAVRNSIPKPLRNYLSQEGPLLNLYRWFYSLATDKNQTFLLKNIRGSKMWVEMRDKGVSQTLFVDGIYEKAETELFERILKPGMTFVDVGGHIGYYTLIAAQRVKHVITFEPNPTNFDLLKKNIEINGYTNVTAVQKLVGKVDGKASVFLDSENSGATSISQENTQHYSDSFVAEFVTLDEFINEPIDVLKIDTQGAEGLVIEGALETIRRDKPIIVMEFCPFMARNCGVDPVKLYECLADLGYKPKVIEEGIQSDLASILQYCHDTHSIARKDEHGTFHIVKGTGGVNLLWQK